MYRIVFSRTHDNPLTGRAAYRVVKCYFIGLNKFGYVCPKWSNGRCGIILPKPRQVGSFINPTRELKKIIQQRSAELRSE